MTATGSIPLQQPSDGWFVYSYHLLSDGSLAALWTDRDIHREYEVWCQKADRNLFRRRRKRPDLWTGRARLAVFNETGLSDTIEIPLVPYPKIDRFPDGSWLVVCPRARGNEKNARTLGSNGTQTSAFHLGDGIEQIRCAPDGSIWVAYFDEGVFGSSVGTGGIVQFGLDRQRMWSYNDPTRNRQSFVDDCYALNLSGSSLWTCFYSDFPIVRIEGGKEKLWSNDVSGAKALAVEGNLVVLAGGYGDDARKISLLQLDQTKAQVLGSYNCEDIGNADLLVGQSSALHLVKSSEWMRISVSDVTVKIY